MHAARRQTTKRQHVSREPVWLKLSTRDWVFYVADELEAFAVIARHDVIDVEAMHAA